MLEFGLQSTRRIFFAGEKITIFLENSSSFPEGRAFLRTNLGMAAVRRHEIINAVEKNQRPAGRDWHDLALQKVSCCRFELELMLTETGVFELKPFFAPSDRNAPILWGSGDNIKIKVAISSITCCTHIHFNA